MARSPWTEPPERRERQGAGPAGRDGSDAAGVAMSARPTSAAAGPWLAALFAACATACGQDLPREAVELASREAAAEAEELHPEASEAISKLRSPFCPGFMLEVCTSREAEELRDSLQAGALAGLVADSLVEWMVATWGEEYRALPEASGSGLLAWVVPPAALLLGLGLVVLALRRLKGPTVVGAGEDGITEDERDRLEAALAELEEMEEAQL